MAFDECFAREWKAIAAEVESENMSGCFDCNICLDFARDPVVTLCGHLYCWPCIHKWFQVQSASLTSDEHPRCPVCKAEISLTMLVPLYGRGQTLEGTEPEGKIPPRPQALGVQALMTSSLPDQQLPHHNPYQNRQYSSPYTYGGFEEDSSPPPFSLSGSTAMGAFHPLIGMFGEMVYARVFGNSESLYTHPNSYQLGGSRSPRLRRQEMQADKSLSRISVFLFCCFILCLIVF
ncbi:hypothetical protein NMG60_11014818 [Bertholletia excelsa]